VVGDKRRVTADGGQHQHQHQPYLGDELVSTEVLQRHLELLGIAVDGDFDSNEGIFGDGHVGGHG